MRSKKLVFSRKPERVNARSTMIAMGTPSHSDQAGLRARLFYSQEKEMRTYLSHDLYRTGDPDAPPTIKDRNNEVVLDYCRRCGQAEIELTEDCPGEPDGKEA